MTVWIYHASMTAEEEAQLPEREYLPLPFEGLPNLTGLAGPAQAIEMLAALYPDNPPESINGKLDRFWNIFSRLHPEDIIAVPLPASQEVLIAEVTGLYQYHEGEHRIPVRFYPVRTPMRTFRKHKELFEYPSPIRGEVRRGANENPKPNYAPTLTLPLMGRGLKITEVTDIAARTLIREQLPHRYNRFAKYKWLLVVFFLMSLVRMAERFTIHSQ